MLGKILNETFGKAYIKNLKSSIERKEFIENNFKKIGLEYEIFEAYDGTKFVNEDYSIKHGSWKLPFPVSAGFWGNQVTTEHILMKEINNNTDSCMIFDDDSYFYNFSRPIETLKTIKNNLPDDWDIIIFGSIEEIYQDFDFQYNQTNSHSACSGCHGTAVKKSVYRILSELFREKQYWGDGCIGRLHDLGKKVYYIHPHIVAQNRKLFSDVNRIHH